MVQQPAAAGARPTPEAAPKKKVSSGLKRLRQGVRRRALNVSRRTVAKHSVARAVELIEGDDAAAAEAAVNKAIIAIDRAEAKGVLPRNSAARRKSRLMHRLHQAAGPKK